MPQKKPLRSTPPIPLGKIRITIRIDEDVLAWFRERVEAAGGGSYQALINATLRRHVEESAEPLEETLRRVLREELDLPSRATSSVKEPSSSPSRGDSIRSRTALQRGSKRKRP